MNFVILLYSTFLIVSILGLILNRRNRSASLLSYTIAVVARNEENTLPLLLKSLSAIDYPQELFEIILVDDGSQDSTYKLMKKITEDYANVRAFTITDKKLPGKKEGLQTALERATKEILLLTDADCIVSPDWLKVYNYYWDKKTSLVVGYAPESYTQTDKLSLPAKHFRRFIGLVAAGIYGVTIGLKIPFSCSGRNLAVRREALLRVGGYKTLTKNKSGDDKQMLNLIRKSGGLIRYNFHKSVSTLPEIDFFQEQQKRRFGKLKMSSPVHLIITLILILFFLYLPFYFIRTEDYFSFIILYSASLILWIVNLIKHKEPFCLLDTIFLLIYPYYFIYYTLLGTIGNWKWKE